MSALKIPSTHCKFLTSVRTTNANVRLMNRNIAVVRECCKDDDASQWRNPNFKPPPRSNPTSDSHKSWQKWLRRGPLHLCKSSSRFAQGFRFRACVTLRTKNVYSASFFSVFPFLSASLYVSKRGAYWDRLCRDVVGRWLVGCHARALWPNGAS